MARVRILVVGYRKFSELVNSVLYEYVEEAHLTLVEQLLSTAVDFQALASQHQADVIVSAGATASYLQATLAIPVVAQPVTEIDILDAVARARRIGPRILLFTFSEQNSLSPRLFEALPPLTENKLTHKTYSTTDEIKEQLLSVSPGKDFDVITGPSYVCDVAEKLGIPSVLIYSKESACTMLDEALRIGNERQETGQQRDQSTPFVIRSPQMERVITLARTYARGSAAVLLQGESGTGKEHIAREIHRLSDYASGELVAVNCASIPNELFESELFGYVTGAFTSARRGGRVGLLEQADGGVLFLDEIGEMPLLQQAKLLRVIQERRLRPIGSNREVPIDFKIIAATNVHLNEAVDRGEFREDLYYRLNVFNLRLPPLRERIEDIDVIAAYYINHYASQYNVKVNARQLLRTLSASLTAYLWPGNVRELQNFMERLVVNAMTGANLDKDRLQQVLPELTGNTKRAPSRLREQEEQSIREAMVRHRGDRIAVAQDLGISTTTLWRRLRKMNFQTDSLSLESSPIDEDRKLN